jgi:hypothetical protein
VCIVCEMRHIGDRRTSLSASRQWWWWQTSICHSIGGNKRHCYQLLWKVTRHLVQILNIQLCVLFWIDRYNPVLTLRSNVLTARTMKSSVFWDLMPYCLVTLLIFRMNITLHHWSRRA